MLGCQVQYGYNHPNNRSAESNDPTTFCGGSDSLCQRQRPHRRLRAGFQETYDKRRASRFDYDYYRLVKKRGLRFQAGGSSFLSGIRCQFLAPGILANPVLIFEVEIRVPHTGRIRNAHEQRIEVPPAII